MSIRRGNHGPLNKHTKSVYDFEIQSSQLTLNYLQTIIEMKIEEAISDADKESQEYKSYDVQRVRLITNKKKAIKDSPFLNSYSDIQLCSLCKSIMKRRRNRYVSLDISVSSSSEAKRRAISVQPVETQKMEPILADNSIVGCAGMFSCRRPFRLKTL